MARQKSTSRNIRDIAYRAYLRVGDFLLPNVTEMQYIILMAAILMLAVLNPVDTYGFLRDIFRENWLYSTLVFVTILGWLLVLGVKIIQPQEHDDGLKRFVCLIHYWFFAILGVFALIHQDRMPMNEISLYAFNYWLTFVLIVLAVLRGGVLLLIEYFFEDNTKYHKFYTQNFNTVQYRPVAFMLAPALVMITMLLFDRLYESKATVIVLSVAYTSFVFMVLNVSMRSKLEYPLKRPTGHLKK